MKLSRMGRAGSRTAQLDLRWPGKSLYQMIWNMICSRHQSNEVVPVKFLGPHINFEIAPIGLTRPMQIS